MCGGESFLLVPSPFSWGIGPLYGFRIDLMGFRSPEGGRGERVWHKGVDSVGGSLYSVHGDHSTFLRKVPEPGFGDSADEAGVTLGGVRDLISLENIRAKKFFDSLLSDSLGGVGGLGVRVGTRTLATGADCTMAMSL